ncbi:putative Type I-U CRISPR-associated protein Cas5/Cas6 [Candidatus Defluviicoccus seviourii]|uniref:Type I-U CRISPR-associated protein Cas5/Cas6 n=1 Tax=Candidatus Defluviicoccus seviourii TaxID=2565273 RepID=A0A564WFR1_9PROT|nr:putative Type I-U CRISPR-associated protein Cas5/Cas6 [Candidatus Defluviicoccus seviourii]
MDRGDGGAETARLAALRAPTTLRWFLTGAELPSVTWALIVGERFQDAVMGTVAEALGHLPDALNPHGPEGPRQGHQHPFYLAEDADGDGVIDHVVLHAPAGLDKAWRWALALVRPAAGEDGVLAPFSPSADWLGRAEMAATPGHLLGSGRVWRSVTPYVPNVHLKPKLGAEDALRRELRQREYPEPSAIEPLAAVRVRGGWVSPEMFATERLSGGTTKGASGHPGTLWRIRFDLSVRGPMALGFGCHLGLGLFRREGHLLGRPKLEPALPTEAETVPHPRKVAVEREDAE